VSTFMYMDLNIRGIMLGCFVSYRNLNIRGIMLGCFVSYRNLNIRGIMLGCFVFLLQFKQKIHSILLDLQ